MYQYCHHLGCQLFSLWEHIDVAVLVDSSFGPGNVPLKGTNFQCTGDEASITDCTYTPVDSDNCCSHSDEAGVRCNPECSVGDVRLVDGSSDLEGRVEMCYNGQYATVCDDSWSNYDASVLCASLGYSYISKMQIVLCLSVCPFFCVSLSVFFCVSLSVYLFLPLSLSVCRSLFVCLCLCLSLSLSVSLSLSLCLSVSLSFSLFLFLIVCVCVLALAHTYHGLSSTLHFSRSGVRCCSLWGRNWRYRLRRPSVQRN